MGAGGEPLQIERRVHVAVLKRPKNGTDPSTLAKRELIVTLPAL